MKFPHLFEFMDLKWLPPSLHATLREILECGNARPFRPYYEWVASHVKREVAASGCTTVVELGAGTAPITRLLAKDPDLKGVQLIVCDHQPDDDTYADLERRYPERVTAKREPIDFSEPQDWPAKTLLLLSGTFHHVRPESRPEVLRALLRSAKRVMICEPLRKTSISAAFVFLSVVPAILLPLWFLPRPGKLRRFFWCWLLPLAPIIFWWDGIVSCIRMWTVREWEHNVNDMLDNDITTKHSWFSQLVLLWIDDPQ